MIASARQWICLALAAVALLVSARAWGDKVDELSRILDGQRGEKAKIAAAIGLGNLADARGVPALIRALSDGSPVVRSLAAGALGHIGDTIALPALERALSDENPGVRRRARDAITSIKRSPTPDDPILTRARFIPKETPRARALVVVSRMGNKTPRAGRAMSDKLHAMVVRELEHTNDVTLDPGAGARLQRFLVDGSITRLTRQENGPWIEVTCEVKLTISNGRGSILSIVSGGATVQTARGSWRLGMEAGLQEEALENAVRGAKRNLLSFLVKQVPTN